MLTHKIDCPLAVNKLFLSEKYTFYVKYIQSLFN